MSSLLEKVKQKGEGGINPPKLVIINLPNAQNWREHWMSSNLELRFYTLPKRINDLIDIRRLINNGFLSNAYSGGRKDFNALCGELDCFQKHIELWRECAKGNTNYIVFEDSNDYSIPEIKKLLTLETNKDIILCNKEWSVKNNRLCGFGNNYLITPKGAKNLLNICLPLRLPLDLEIRNVINSGFVDFDLIPIVERSYKFSHSTEESNKNTDFGARQHHDCIYNRFFRD